jgi:dolichol kinase
LAVPALEYRRKGYHMLSGVLVPPLVVFTSLEYTTLLALTALLFILVAEILHMYWGIRLEFFSDQLARTKREYEVFSWASISFLATIVLLLWLAPLPVAFAASALLALGDGVSALVGRAIGRHPLPYNRNKTWEGSTAGFLAGAAGALLILVGYYWLEPAYAFEAGPLILVCVVGAFFAMVAESLPRGEDNVTVPLFSAVAMTLLWWSIGMAPAAAALYARLFG